MHPNVCRRLARVVPWVSVRLNQFSLMHKLAHPQQDGFFYDWFL
jgi:hypothetical protein